MKTELENLSYEIFGGSHEKEIGITVWGLPAKTIIDTGKLQQFLSRRAPSYKDYSSGRNEADTPIFKSGIENGVLNGKPLCAVIENTDIKKEDYKGISLKPRPSHADYTAFLKYGKIPSGGGMFSGRMTAPLCVLGGICLQILNSKGIKIISRISEIGGIKDSGELDDSIVESDFPTVDKTRGEEMLSVIKKAKAEGDSLGGVIECKIIGIPKGIGGAGTDGIESHIANTVFSVPAVKGIEFGSGFSGSKLKGSQNNDEFLYENGKIITSTNNCGGILGGISNGMPVVFKVALKPTPSISKPQKTVDLVLKENTEIEIKGRHDPCIVPRAVPCIEAAAAIAVFDMLNKENGEDLSSFRKEIDAVDNKITELFKKRMEISGKIAKYKMQNGKKIEDKSREEEKLNDISSKLPDYLKKEGEELFSLLFNLSKAKQKKYMGKFGLLGLNLNHSYSPLIHKLLCGYDYKLFDDNNPLEFIRKKEFDGINVTMPYKKTVLPLLDELSETAKETGNVNTVVKTESGSLKGYNTDVYGFIYLLKENNIDVFGKKIIVLGSGGASNSVCYALKKSGASDITVISRGGKDNYENIANQKSAQIIVNATPVGMYPETSESPLDLEEFNNLEAVIDLIYNPHKTKLLLSAQRKGVKAVNGLLMLAAQAKKSAELFLDTEISDDSLKKAAQMLEKTRQNIYFIGMPSCGKTTLAKEMGNLLNKEVFDTDLEIYKKYFKTAEEIIKERGEEDFRKIETEILKDLSFKRGILVSCGGGIVERKENIDIMHQNGEIIYLKKDISLLNDENRPISQKEGIENLYKRRGPLYESSADKTVIIDNSISENIKKIAEVL